MDTAAGYGQCWAVLLCEAMTRLSPTAAAVAVLLLAVTAGCSGDDSPAAKSEPSPSPSPSPAGVTVTGVMRLSLPGFVWDEDPLHCEGSDGYSDITAGTQVTVTDPAGTVLGIGKLGVGMPNVESTIEGDRATACSLPFQVPGVPSGHGIYGVEVGHRGVVRFPEDQLSGITLTLD